MRETLQKNKAYFFPIYLAAFLFAFHVALPLYINSSFLKQFLPESAIGFVYSAASVLIILFLIKFPDLLARAGNYKTIIGLLILQILLLLALASPLSAFFIIPAFVLAQAIIVLVIFNLDVFIERFSIDKTTGRTRGNFLTVINLAILLGPLTTGVILTNGNFSKIYIVAAIFLIPVVYIITKFLRDFKDPQYHRTPYIKTLSDILLARHPNDEMRHVIVVNLILRFFFAWMVIYTPIYLYTYAGFDWQKIGIMFAIMLLPFVLFEMPMGRLADTRVGEKKIMIAGFFIMALFTAALFFIQGASFALWAALLFGTRVGASFVEITSESYFFKHIDSSDTELLSIFRDSEPVAYIVAPLAASALLAFVSMNYLFLVLSAVLLYGAWGALHMKPVQRTEHKHTTTISQIKRF